MLNPLAANLAEQAALAAEPPAERTFGWWLGMDDLIAEEILIRTETHDLR